jgi:hypothetical protein
MDPAEDESFSFAGFDGARLVQEKGDITLCETVKLSEGCADAQTIVEADTEAVSKNQVISDDTLATSSAFHTARAKWTEAAQQAAEDAAVERAAAEERAAKLRMKEIGAAAAARRREEIQVAKQREKELKALEEDFKKSIAKVSKQKCLMKTTDDKQVEANSHTGGSTRSESDDRTENREDESPTSPAATEVIPEAADLGQEELLRKINEERESKLVAAKELIAQRERTRLRKVADREEEALRQAEAREQAARAKAAELAMRRTLPVLCQCGSELMVTRDEMDALNKYVPNFAEKTAEELAELLPKLYMGSWLHGTKHLFAKT